MHNFVYLAQRRSQEFSCEPNFGGGGSVPPAPPWLRHWYGHRKCPQRSEAYPFAVDARRYLGCRILRRAQHRSKQQLAAVRQLPGCTYVCVRHTATIRRNRRPGSVSPRRRQAILSVSRRLRDNSGQLCSRWHPAVSSGVDPGGGGGEGGDCPPPPNKNRPGREYLFAPSKF